MHLFFVFRSTVWVAMRVVLVARGEEGREEEDDEEEERASC